MTSLTDAIKTAGQNWSIEVTPPGAGKIESFAEVLAEGTTVNVTFLPGTDPKDTVDVAVRLREDGMNPVPHIAARSLQSKEQLDDLVKDMTNRANVNEVLVIGGGVDNPVGEFSDSMQVLATGIFQKYGITSIGVSGHPEGSPDISDDEIAHAMGWKNDFAHKEGLDGRCFHLIDQNHYKVGEVVNIFARAGHAPQMTMRIDTRMFGFIPPFVRKTLSTLPPVKRISGTILHDLGIPKEVLKFTDYFTKFDDREARAELAGSGIECPKIEDYSWKLWDYWARHMDPDLFIDRTLEGRISGKVVVVTGATSGIGKATAIKLAEAGAKVVLAARTVEKLDETKALIESNGGEAYPYSVDISDMADCDRFAKQVLEDFGHVDVLVNNAGRSIRRSINLSYDRFHDFERTMQLNYFGALRMIMNFLPVMEQRRSGHIINISSIGTLTLPARFSAYVASKSALDAFSRCAASEFSDCNVHFSTINMPLVRTPMIAPTKIYEHVPTISPEEAADKVCEAIIYRSKRIATKLGIFGQVVHAVTPKFAEVIINTGFRMFPDSAAAKGDKPQEGATQVSPEQMAFAYLMRGIHW